MSTETAASLVALAAADPAPAPEAAPAPAAPTLPDWIADKFKTHANPIEEQARAYTEAQRLLGTKQDALKAEVQAAAKDEALAAFRAEYGTPETAEAYALPGELTADAPLLEGFRAKAFELGMSQKQFEGMAALYAETQAIDVAAEMAKLGDKAAERASAFNLWGSKHIPKALHGAAMKVCRTAEGFQLLESLMRAALPGGVLPAAETVEIPEAPTQDKLREMMKDERYKNPAKRQASFVAEVEAYAARLSEAKAKAA